ncbi:MAG: hypothetical protein J6S28_06150 [Clostridia bacterium]|jgi:hypothetical protein|nr:hypothetical protein [Clostridia bacterium]MBQ5362232.1 hypothetical protein [Clostridia bacterium]
MRQNENRKADYNTTASSIQARQWANAARHKYLSRVLRTVAPRPSAVFGALGEQNLAHADRLAKLVWERGGDPGLQVRFTTPKIYLGDDAHSRAPVVVRRAINQSVTELGEVLHLYKRLQKDEDASCETDALIAETERQIKELYELFELYRNA